MIARTTLGRGLAVALSVAVSQIAVPAAHAATTHLVDSGQVVQRLLDTAKSRDEKVRLFQSALDTPEARQQARSMGLNPDKLRAAVPHLSDAELQDLSKRTADQKDVVAGHRGRGTAGLVILGVVLLVAGLAVLAAAGGYDEYYDEGCYCY